MEASAGKKHPLNTEWCFWLRNAGGGQAAAGASAAGSARGWAQQQILGHSFETVEDFWCLINNISNPFEGSNNSNIDYSIFRKGINPDYDAPEFAEGGRIIIKLSRSNSAPKAFDGWVHILLSLIGESFDELGSQCCVGLRLVIKRGNVKFEVWTTDKQPEKLKALSEAFAKLLEASVDLSKPQAEFESFDKSVSFKVAEAK